MRIRAVLVSLVRTMFEGILNLGVVSIAGMTYSHRVHQSTLGLSCAEL